MDNYRSIGLGPGLIQEFGTIIERRKYPMNDQSDH